MKQQSHLETQFKHNSYCHVAWSIDNTHKSYILIHICYLYDFHEARTSDLLSSSMEARFVDCCHARTFLRTEPGWKDSSLDLESEEPAFDASMHVTQRIKKSGSFHVQSNSFFLRDYYHLRFSFPWCVHIRCYKCPANAQQAAQATFKSIKSLFPLLDRVLVQRFKPETVRVSLFGET